MGKRVASEGNTAPLIERQPRASLDVDDERALEAGVRLWPELPPLQAARGALNRNRGLTLTCALVLADVLAFTGALLLAALAAAPDSRGLSQIPWGFIVLPIWGVLMKIYGMYDRDRRRVSHSTVDDVPGAFHLSLLAALLLRLVCSLAPVNSLVLAQGATFFFAAFFLSVALRGVARRTVRALVEPERAAIVGTGAWSALVARKVTSHPEYSMSTIGYLSIDGDDGEVPGLARLGSPSELATICEAERIEHLIVVAPELSPELVGEVARNANVLGLRVSVLPHVADLLGPSTVIDDVEGITLLGINPVGLSRSSRALKRMLDVFVAFFGLLLWLPVLPFLALAIKLDSPGPVFFVQRRIGRHGRPFRFYKLRSMERDAEARAEGLRAQSAHPAWLSLSNDPRVTRVGRVLRRTSIDELPQLWNVLRGEMSLVGPRPMNIEVYEHITGWGRRRLDITPGMTGVWQVLGRTAIPLEEMVTLDYLYVTNWSLWGDLRILLRTMPAVLARRGAN